MKYFFGDKKSKTSFILALIPTFYVIFMVMVQTISYGQPLAILKLWTLRVLFIFSTFFAYFYIFKQFSRSSLLKSILIASIYFLIWRAIWTKPSGFFDLENYILIGNYLRDTHGINIYYMDWSGWMLLLLLYFPGVLTAILVMFFETLPKKIKLLPKK